MALLCDCSSAIRCTCAYKRRSQLVYAFFLYTHIATMVLVQMEYKSAISVLIQSAYVVATRERKCIMAFCSTIYSSEHSIVHKCRNMHTQTEVNYNLSGDSLSTVRNRHLTVRNFDGTKLVMTVISSSRPQSCSIASLPPGWIQ